MNQKLDTDTGEIVVQAPEIMTDLVLGSGVAVMSPEQAKKAVDYLQDIKKSILKEGVDFGVIPNTGNKPTLFKPGAQKLCAFFLLAAHYETEQANEQPDKVWEYEYYNKYEKHKEQKQVTGYYSYRVRCTLIHRATNQTWGTGIGLCMNTEKGRQSSEANTIIKMAEKRAFLQATLDATFSSELFTQDVEDYPSSGTADTGEIKIMSPAQYDLIMKLKKDESKDYTQALWDDMQKALASADSTTMGTAAYVISRLIKSPKKKVG